MMLFGIDQLKTLQKKRGRGGLDAGYIAAVGDVPVYYTWLRLTRSSTDAASARVAPVKCMRVFPPVLMRPARSFCISLFCRTNYFALRDYVKALW